MTDGAKPSDGDKIDLVPLVRQRLMWDMLPPEHDYWDVLEATPPSQDVAFAQVMESQARMQKIAPYQNFIEIYAVLTADIITEIMFKNLQRAGGEPSTENLHDTTQLQNREIVRGAVYPILAALIDVGYLQPAGKVIG